MPRYSFTTNDGSGSETTEEPISLKNDDAAADQAQQALADMAHEALPDGGAVDLSADVDNEAGQRIYEGSLKFRGKSADRIEADNARNGTEADEATDTIVRALDGMEPSKTK